MTWRAGGGGLLTPWGAAAPPLPAAPLGAGGRGGRHVLLLLLPASGLTAPSAAALEPMGESLIGAASLGLPPTQAFPMCPALPAENVPGCDGAGRPPCGAAGACGTKLERGAAGGAGTDFPLPPCFPVKPTGAPLPTAGPTGGAGSLPTLPAGAGPAFPAPPFAAMGLRAAHFPFDA